MILHFAILLSFQLAGEVISRLLFPSAPGPVIGLALLVLALAAIPRLAEELRATVNGFLAHLSLFFVPAGVGVVTQLPQIGADAFAICAAILISTAAAITVGAFTFASVARLTGYSDD
ncbi:MAG: CidA/LrgA family protein [Pseudomonadota bacterium]